MPSPRFLVTTGGSVLLAFGIGLLAGCGKGADKSEKAASPPEGTTNTPAAPGGKPGPGPMRFNTYRSPTVYLSDPAAVDDLTPGKTVTVDGLVTLWDEKPRIGETKRYVRLVGHRKTKDPEGQKYFFECALPDGAAGFEGLRLEHVARVRGTVVKQDKLVMATPVPQVFLGDCKLVSVANDTIPPPKPVLDEVKALQGTWRVTRAEGGTLAPKNYGASEIRITDCLMTWTNPIKDGGSYQAFGIKVDPGKSPREMNLYRTGYHMVPAVYELKGDTLRICLQLPIDNFSENIPRPKKVEPGPDKQVVLVAERAK